MTLNSAETSVVKSQPSVPYGANLLLFITYIGYLTGEHFVCVDAFVAGS